jgi:hypothetical protein
VTVDDALRSINLTRFDVNRLRRGSVAGVLIAAHEFAVGSLNNIAKAWPKLPKIHFAFVDDGTLNAGAFAYQKEYVIFVNTGAMGLFSLYYTRVLADKDLFRDIPSASHAATPGSECGRRVCHESQQTAGFGSCL